MSTATVASSVWTYGARSSSRVRQIDDVRSAYVVIPAKSADRLQPVERLHIARVTYTPAKRGRGLAGAATFEVFAAFDHDFKADAPIRWRRVGEVVDIYDGDLTRIVGRGIRLPSDLLRAAAYAALTNAADGVFNEGVDGPLPPLVVTMPFNDKTIDAFADVDRSLDSTGKLMVVSAEAYAEYREAAGERAAAPAAVFADVPVDRRSVRNPAYAALRCDARIWWEAFGHPPCGYVRLLAILRDPAVKRRLAEFLAGAADSGRLDALVLRVRLLAAALGLRVTSPEAESLLLEPELPLVLPDQTPVYVCRGVDLPTGVLQTFVEPTADASPRNKRR